jgi:hypothetical protein
MLHRRGSDEEEVQIEYSSRLLNKSENVDGSKNWKAESKTLMDLMTRGDIAQVEAMINDAKGRNNLKDIAEARKDENGVFPLFTGDCFKFT